MLEGLNSFAEAARCMVVREALSFGELDILAEQEISLPMPSRIFPIAESLALVAFIETVLALIFAETFFLIVEVSLKTHVNKKSDMFILH